MSKRFSNYDFDYVHIINLAFYHVYVYVYIYLHQHEYDQRVNYNTARNHRIFAIFCAIAFIY